MSEIGRRAFAAIVGSGAFVFFDKTYRSDGGSTGGNATATDDVDIRLEGEVLNVVQDDTSSDVTVSVDVDAVNYGTTDGTQLVEFVDQVETLEERSVSVASGATEPLQFSEIYQSITESDVTLNVTNDTNPPQVALDLPRSDIQFSNATITDDTGTVISEIEEGQTFFVSGDVENFGAIDGDKTYVLYGDSDQLDSTTVNLASGATSTIELSHTYNDLGLASGETSKPIDLSVNEQGVGEISIFKPAIPDSVVSRPDDNTSTSTSGKLGFEIDTNSEWPSIGCRISANSSGFQTAYLRDSGGSNIDTVDISSLSAGDTFTFDNVDLAVNTTYQIVVDAGGGSWTAGFNDQTNENYPLTTTDIDITGGFFEGSVGTGYDGGAVNDIGNTGF